MPQPRKNNNSSNFNVTTAKEITMTNQKTKQSITIKGNFIRGFLILGLIFLGATSRLMAQTGQNINDAEVAQKYSETYADRNIAGLREFLAEDAVFDDPSSHFEGADVVVEGLTGIFNSVTRLEFEPSTKYRSGNQFVFSGIIDFNFVMPVSEEKVQEFNFKLDFMIVLKVVNGKVVHHTDYFDTEAFNQQVVAQMNAD